MSATEWAGITRQNGEKITEIHPPAPSITAVRSTSWKHTTEPWRASRPCRSRAIFTVTETSANNSGLSPFVYFHVAFPLEPIFIVYGSSKSNNWGSEEKERTLNAFPVRVRLMNPIYLEMQWKNKAPDRGHTEQLQTRGEEGSVTAWDGGRVRQIL